MRLEEVTAEIRPRSDWEAVDLGFAMTRRDFWRCLAVWWLALLVPLVVVGWFLREMPLLLVALFWWWKPAGSRMVLFEISRRLFGEKPGWKAALKELPKVWTRRFFHRFVWARFSPWLPVNLAVEDLEGLRGKAFGQRTQQLARRGDGAVMWIYFLTDLTAGWLALGLFLIAAMFLPEGQDGPWMVALETWDDTKPFDIPPMISWTVTICSMLAMSLVDLFVTGAGFGIYVNNRTWLEGWDVELAFKRLGQRLGKLVAVLAVVFSIFAPMQSRAAEVEKTDVEIMSEVKSDPDFKVHVFIEKRPRWNVGGSSGMFGVFAMLGQVFAWAVGGTLLGLLGWLIWKYRHAFMSRGRAGEMSVPEIPKARVVMGMEVSAESLPKDIPSGAWALWQLGRRHEALGLLYRGAISKSIDGGQVDIHESDTEGDCLRRVETAGPPAHPEYFRGLTGTWMRLAYAGLEPPDVEVQALCRDWPFVERRSA